MSGTERPKLNAQVLASFFMRLAFAPAQTRYVPQVANEMDVQMLDQTLPEAKPWTLQRGTKDSIILGGNRCLAKLDQLDKERKLELAGRGCRGRAISVWDAKPLPPDVKHVPNNAIICTRSLQQDGADGDGEAPGVLGLSGGDHDGDEVDISFDPDLVAFVTATQQFRGRA
ncbi:unnamed protein product [Symbiodinium microadriaticum]|nr:unnamed protein product [Symbiodinium microadriaticum]